MSAGAPAQKLKSQHARNRECGYYASLAMVLFLGLLLIALHLFRYELSSYALL